MDYCFHGSLAYAVQSKLNLSETVPHDSVCLILSENDCRLRDLFVLLIESKLLCVSFSVFTYICTLEEDVKGRHRL